MTAATKSFTIRRAEDRGKTELRWLYGRHSFSFGRYYDPGNLGYRSLRVINDDIIAPASGFGEHGHDNMEILTWVLQGALHHRDSTGGDGELRPGKLQAMTAGRGIRHSEFNDSPVDSVHLLQIWLEPNKLDLPPRYNETAFPFEGRQGKWQVLASSDGRNASIQIHQNAILSVAELQPGQNIELQLAAERHAYVHVAYGSLQVGETVLKSGDAITFSGPDCVKLDASESSQILFFDLA